MLKFSKMHGLGNDFIVINAMDAPVHLTEQQLRFLSDRHIGIGCDQVLFVEPSEQSDVDFRYRIFNADGGEVAQCGNGARCFARYVRDVGLTDKKTIAVETASGLIYPQFQDNDLITVDMGLPRFAPIEIPFHAPEQSQTYSLNISENQQVEISAVSMGNPHAVLLVEDVEHAPVLEWGPIIEHHAQFPERVNVGFMQVVDAEHVRLRVFERGSGETSACGTGACAAVVSGIQRGVLAREVTVSLPGGDLKISWAHDGASVMMTGPAEHVFDGEISWAKLNNL